MADNSKISWTDATWNVITGCSIYSPGCTNCYAMKLAGGRLKNHFSRIGLTEPSKAGPVWTGEVRWNEEWFEQPLHWRDPRMIFVCAHGDLFHEKVPEEWICRVLDMTKSCPQHIFQILTKRAFRMRQFMESHFRKQDFPNVWFGVSVEDQDAAEARLYHLLQTRATIRWVSLEPLLGPVELTGIDVTSHGMDFLNALNGARHLPLGTVQFLPRLDWVVVGGESQSGARPMHPIWARQVRDDCQSYGVPFHFKQWGAWSPKQPKGYCRLSRRTWSHESVTFFPDGTRYDAQKPDQLLDPDIATLYRHGIKSEDTELDGRAWDEMPGAA